MKLITFDHNGRTKAGFLDGDVVVVCDDSENADHAVLARITDGTAAQWAVDADGFTRVPLADVTLLSPIPVPLRDLLCVGKNYYAHAAEFFGSGFDSSAKEEVPSHPVIFNKSMTAVVGPGVGVQAAFDPTGSVDYEGELGVVIGKRARSVSKADAYDYVFGYVIVNDVTSREIQKKHNQWFLGKSIDTFCPMGPWIATADEITNLDAMALETRINGELRQKTVMSDMVFDIPTLIETITATQTLLPGDIIATGTPAGVGIGFNPPKYLKAGDIMSVTITGLGTLENPII